MKDMFSNPIRDNLTEQEVWRLAVEHWQDVKALICSITHEQFVKMFCTPTTNPINFVKKSVLSEWVARGKITPEQYTCLIKRAYCFLCAFYDGRRCSECPLQNCKDDDSIFSEICDAADEYKNCPDNLANTDRICRAINKLIETVQKGLKTRYIE